jgi:hypothetical protein
MRNSIVFILITIFSLAGISQEDTIPTSKFYHGSNFGTYISGGSYGLSYNIDYTIEKENILLAIGPIIGPTLYVWPDQGIRRKQFNLKLNGLHTSFIVYPNTRQNTFNLFFQYDLAYLRYNADWSYDNLFETTQIKNLKESIIENTISYGIRINFLKRFHIYNSIGLGYAFNFRNYEYEHGTTRKSSQNYFTGLIKIGAGFKI